MNGEWRRSSHLKMKWRSIAPASLSKHQHPQLVMRWVLASSRRQRLRNEGSEHELPKYISCHDRS